MAGVGEIHAQMAQKEEPRPFAAWLLSALGNSTARNWFWQAALIVTIVAAAWFFAHNAVVNLTQRNMTSGFDFLWRTAGFDIEQSPIAWTPTDSYGRALLVGLCNTLLAAVVSIVLATILGFIIAMMRLSPNWLLRTSAGAYIEVLRNTPAILQVIFWYFAVLAPLPSPRNSFNLGGVLFLNVRGLFLPKPVFSDAGPALLISAVVAVLGLIVILRMRRALILGPAQTVLASVGTVIGVPAIVFLAAGVSLHWDIPALRGFNFAGGLRLFPEFTALVLGLSVYASSFIAEIIRAGVTSVGRGPIEAARSLGLRKTHILFFITMPLAMRVIVPPLTSQYLRLVKNTSLAVVIGFPEVVQIFAGSVLNQSGQAIEVMGITMLIYLTISLCISLFMNWYNRRVVLVER